MFESITPEVLKQRVFDALKTDIDTREGSYTSDLVAPAMLEVWKIYQALNGLIPMMFPDETSGAYIDKKCAYYGITRKAGTKATATLTITGNTGKTVPKGAVFLTAENLRFVTDAAVTLAGSSSQVAATAAEVGSAYNVGAGAIIRQLSSIPGVTAVTNASAAQGGSDPETDAALLARLYERLQSPATSGNAAHYKQWALSVAGVGAAKVLPLSNGPGTVKVLIASSGMGPVDAAIVQTCAAYIETVRPIGAAVTVETVEWLNINVSATVAIDASTTVEAVQVAFTAALEKYLQSISFVQYTVPYSRIGFLLAGIDGVLDYTGLTVNGGTANVTVAANQVPMAGAVSII